MKLTMRAAAKKVTLITTAFVLAVSTLTAAVPFILSQNASAASYDVAVSDLAATVAGAADGDVINVTGTGSVASTISIAKDITIHGNGATITVTGGSNVFSITPAGAGSTIEGITFDKTDATSQNIVQVLGNNVSILNNTFTGQYDLGEGETARGLEIGGSLSGLNISGNSFQHLRQPAYINNLSSGSIANNYIDITRGWVVVADTNFTFSGNTWGTNAVGIAFIPQGLTSNTYTCAVQAQIKANNPGVTIQNQVDPTVCLDTPTNLQPVDGSATNDPNFTMSWNAVSGATVYEYRTSNTLVDATTLGPIAYADSSATASNYTLGTQTITRGNNGTPANTWYWQVRAGNGSGAWSAWSAISLVTTDYTAPEKPAHVSPANNAVQNSNNFFFDWSDVAGAARYEIQNSQNPAVDANGSFQNVQWTGDYQHVQPTVSQAQSVGANGTWYWQVRAIDAAGNASGWTTPWKVTIDQAGPTITVQPSSIGSEGRYSKVGFNFYDANKVDYITINGAVKELSNSEYSNVDNIGSPYWYGAVEGNNTLVAYDVAGNSTTLNFVIDRTAPVSVTFTHSNNNDNTLVNTDVTSTLTASEALQTPAGWTPVAGSNGTEFTKVSTANNKGNITVTDLAGNSKTVAFEVKRIDKTAPTFNIADGAVLQGTSKEVVVNEENFGAVAKIDGVNTPTTNTKPNYKVTVTGEGVHTVIATDKAGNTSTVSFTLDNTGPAIVFTQPTSLNLGNRNSVLVEATTDDAVSYEVRLNGSLVQSGDTPFTGYVVNTAAGGSYTVQVKAYDQLGNVGSNQVTFTVDNDGPNLVTSLVDGTTVGESLTIESEVGDGDEDTFGLAIYSVDDLTTPLLSSGSLAYTFNTRSLANGDYVAILSAQDSFGNESTRLIDFTVFNAPVVVVTQDPNAAPGNDGGDTTPANLPSAVGPAGNVAAVLGLGNTNTGDDTTGGTEGVEGTSTEKNLAAAVDTDSTDGTVLGMAWYWWLLILAALATLIWWIIASIRNRAAQN